MTAERQQPTMDLLHLWAEGTQVSAVPPAASWIKVAWVSDSEVGEDHSAHSQRPQDEQGGHQQCDGEGGLPGRAVCIRHQRPNFNGP